MAKHLLNRAIVYELGTKCTQYLPKPLLYGIGRIIADISFIFCKSSVKKITSNFETIFPDTSPKDIAKKTRQLFRNYAEYLVDYGRFSGLNKETLLHKIIHFDGENNLIDALNMKKGLILLTAHLGNWELGGIFFSAYGLKVNVLTLPDDDNEVDSSRSQYRKNYGVKTITVGDSPLSSINLVNALSNNEVLAMLIDRYRDDTDGIQVNLFNKPHKFPKGPFILSRITGAPIVVAFVVKENGQYKGLVEKPFIVTSENEERDLIEKVVRIFEKYIVQYADQWYDFR